MIIKDLKNCKEIIAGDKTILRELLSPRSDNTKARYSIAHAIVKKGEASLPHILQTSEVYYILEGEGEIHIGDESDNVRAGQVVDVPPHSIQYIRNTGCTDLKLLCIVDPAWRPEDEQIL